jgi:hypothetical protein
LAANPPGPATLFVVGKNMGLFGDPEVCDISFHPALMGGLYLLLAFGKR